MGHQFSIVPGRPFLHAFFLYRKPRWPAGEEGLKVDK
jgi:hypothetical protein